MPEFMPSLPVLAAFAFASAILALTPGPDMTLFLSKTVSQSRAAGIASMFGATSGVVIHSVLAALGLSALLAASPTAFTILKFVGAAYLAWLAVDAIRNGSSFSLAKGGEKETIGAVYLKGLAIDLLNPKVIVFFVTFLPQFVSPGDAHPASKLLILGLTFALVSIPVCLPLIFFADRIASWLKRSRWATRAVDYLFATVLGAFAIRLLLAERN